MVDEDVFVVVDVPSTLAGSCFAATGVATAFGASCLGEVVVVAGFAVAVAEGAVDGLDGAATGLVVADAAVGCGLDADACFFNFSASAAMLANSFLISISSLHSAAVNLISSNSCSVNANKMSVRMQWKNLSDLFDGAHVKILFLGKF